MFANVCPECQEGKVFRSFLFVNKKCSHCGYRFEKEEGYFFGPMTVAYILMSFIAIPIFVILAFSEGVNFLTAFYFMIAGVVVIGPIIYRYSKLGWLQLETRFEKTQDAERKRADQIVKDRQGK